MKTQITLSDLIALARRTPGAIRERLQDRALRRQLRTLPLRSLGDVREHEPARFAGVIRPLERQLLEAPLSGRLCVYYDVSIEGLVEGAFAGVLRSEQEALPFVVADGEHRATIDPSHARISAGFDFVSEHALAGPHSLSEREKLLLVRLGLVGLRHPLLDGLRFREAILEVDERVTVVGGGVREPDPLAPPRTYRSDGRTWLRVVGTERHPVIISDDPRSL